MSITLTLATYSSPMSITQPKIFQYLSFSPEFSNVHHTDQNSPISITALNSPMSVTQPKIFQYLSYSPEISNVHHGVEKKGLKLQSAFAKSLGMGQG